MSTTIPYTLLGRKVNGYMLNIGFDDTARRAVAAIQEQLQRELGDVVWLAPANALHATLVDWVAPFSDYGRPHQEEFDAIFARYDQAITNILREVRPIEVKFDVIKATPDTVIIIGHDDGQFQEIRRKFVEAVDFPAVTKQPPTIIHSSIVRFTKEMPFERVEQAAAGCKIDFVQTVNNFRLVQEIVVPELEFEVVKTYSFA